MAVRTPPILRWPSPISFGAQPTRLQIPQQAAQLSVDSRYPLSTARITFRPSRRPVRATSIAVLSFSRPAFTQMPSTHLPPRPARRRASAKCHQRPAYHRSRHMPKAHQRPTGVDALAPHRLGAYHRPQTAALVAAILADRPHPKQGYRACLGILRLAKRYGPARLEAACARGGVGEARSYPHVVPSSSTASTGSRRPRPHRSSPSRPSTNMCADGTTISEGAADADRAHARATPCAQAEASLADTICDRLLHNAHRLVLKGPSRRKEAKLED